MKQKTVITISRQFGSGGRVIGKQLADRLGIPFYDHELISMAAKETGFSEEVFERVDEKASSSLLYSLYMGSYMMGGGLAAGPAELPFNDKVFLIQSQIIRDVAAQGSCVIVGRCADYVLKNEDDCINAYIYADLASRVDRAVHNYEVPPDKAEDVVIKTDKRRAAYYSYYSGRKWGQAENYDLSLNSGKLGEEGCIQILETVVRLRNR